MYIANPIYDVFFKFLLEDLDLAKHLITVIIDEDIIELSIAPQELTISSQKHFLSVVRLDFKAVIKTQTGEYKTVLIEMQKGNVAFDITRFRRYLAKNYERKETVVDAFGNSSEKPLPIIAIYFLGFELETFKIPVLKVAHNYSDASTKKPLKGKDAFVELLIHDCFVIQIPHLPPQARTRLEKVLSIFNQQYTKTDDHRILNIPFSMTQDADIKAFIDRLGKPLLDETLLQAAYAEDELDAMLDDMQRQLEKQTEIALTTKKTVEEQAKALMQKDKIAEEQAKALMQKDKIAEEQAKLIAELQKQLEQKK